MAILVSEKTFAQTEELGKVIRLHPSSNPTYTITLTDADTIEDIICPKEQDSPFTCERGANQLTVKLNTNVYPTENIDDGLVEIHYPNGNIKRYKVLVPRRLEIAELTYDGRQLPKSLRLHVDEVSKMFGAKYRIDGEEQKTSIKIVPQTADITVTGNAIVAKNPSGLNKSFQIRILSEEGSIPLNTVEIEVTPKIASLTLKEPIKVVSETDNYTWHLQGTDSNRVAVVDFRDIVCSVAGESEKEFQRIVSVTPPTDATSNRIVLNVETMARNTIDAELTTSGTIECKTRYTTFDGFDLTINTKSGSINVEALNGNTLLPNGRISFLTRVFNTTGNKSSRPISYVLDNKGDNEQWVSLTPEGEKLTVSWIHLPRSPESVRPAFVSIKVTSIPSESRYPVSTTITVHMASVTKFSSLKVKLNLMDERTAGDLYGDVTKDEYYVLMVRLFNDLKDRDYNRYTGESILAYSSSIEVAVELEKKFDSGAKTGNFGAVFDKKQMKDFEKVRKEQGYATFKESVASLDRTFSIESKKLEKLTKEAVQKEALALRLETEARSDRTQIAVARRARQAADNAYEEIIALRNRLRNLYRYNIVTLPQIPLPDNVAIDDGKWYPAGRDDLMRVERQEAFLSPEDDDSIVSLSDNEPNCVDTITYRPFTFEMMVNTVDRRDDRTMRSRIFKFANLAAFGLSTITAVAVPAASSDLPLGTEKFGNVLIPGLEELFPTLKEQHRQNIVAQTMKPIEEIPFGADLTRVLFIPKKPIRGLIDGHKARISQICPFYFKVKVAVVSKGGEVVLGNQIP